MPESPGPLLGAEPLKGRVALVTGAAHNIGRAITIAYADSGADVVIHAHSSGDEAQRLADEVRSRGRRAHVAVADVRDQAAVSSMVGAAVESLGAINVLVNNAAVRKEAPFEELPVELWREAIGVTLDGAFFCAQAVIGGMIAAGLGDHHQPRGPHGPHRGCAAGSRHYGEVRDHRIYQSAGHRVRG